MRWLREREGLTATLPSRARGVAQMSCAMLMLKSEQTRQCTAVLPAYAGPGTSGMFQSSKQHTGLNAGP